MACRTIAVGPGMFAIACGRGSRRTVCSTPACGRDHEALCDWPVARNGKEGTCDRKLCGICRVRQGVDKDFCPPHAKLARSRPPRAGDPKRGDHRVHVQTGIELWVYRVDTQGEEIFVTFGRNPPDRGRCAWPMQTVTLAKWNEKTRAP